MKKNIGLTIITLGLLILSAPLNHAAQESQTAEVLLGAALHQEEVEGDFEGAIETYKEILTRFPDNRQLAAEAQFRMGRCYEKLGRTEAKKAYEAVLSKYADQSKFAAMARKRLDAMTVPGPPTMTARMLENPPPDSPGCAVSPDGRFLTFNDGRTGDLVIRDLRTLEDRFLTDEGTEGEEEAAVRQWAEGSVWSPDGREIAYVWNIQSDTAQTELRGVGVDGGRPRIISRHEKSIQEMGSFAWSPDSKHIAATLNSGSLNIVLISTDDGSIRTLVELKQEIFPTNKAFSPDGRHIACDRLPEKTSPERDIYLISIDSGREIPLIQHPADDYLLGWSRDGRWLVFASDRTEALGLWVVGMSGNRIDGEPILVRPGIERILPVGLTNQGSLFYGVVRATEDIFAVDMDPETGKVAGSPRKAIEHYEGGNFTPSYSPDGEHLAYVSRRGNSPYPTNVGNALCIRTWATGEERVFYKEIWRLGLRHIAVSGWSPDGRSVIFRGSPGIYPNGLYRIDLETDEINRIVSLSPDERTPGGIFGPEGRCYFVRANIKDRYTQILCRDLTSSQERELYRQTGAERIGIALSPDGRRLSFANAGWGGTRSLNIIPISGGETREIWNFGETKRGMPPISHIWSPDGRSILFSSPDPEDMRIWNLWRIRIHGGQPEKTGLQTKWGLWDLTMHPNGRGLLFAGRGGPSTDSELWVLENFLPSADKSN